MGKFNDLPEEIMLDIFTRLPAESVLDCKLVCKPWRDVVRNPSFSQIHLNHLLHSAADNLGKASFVFYCSDDKEWPPEFYYGEYDENYHEKPFCSRITRVNLNLNRSLNNLSIVGSCNGLICFRYNNYGPVYICNPITREYAILPDCEGNCWWSGFGYVLSTNEYKVVRICENRLGSNYSVVVHVYTLGSGTGWRNLGETGIDWTHVRVSVGVFADGAFHWMDEKGTTVIAFRLADEKFSELPAPPPYLTPHNVPYFYTRLGVLRDFLSATHYYYRKGGGYDIWIWLRKKNKDNNDFSWVKELKFVSFVCDVPKPFGFTESGRLLFTRNRKIYSCDPKALSAIMDVSFGKFVNQAIPHKNTLVSLKVLGEKDTKILKSGERPSASEWIENNDKLKKTPNNVRDRVVGLYAICVEKFTVAIQKLHLPKCC